MAKRTPENEVPYRPLDKVLVQSVLSGATAPTAAVGGASAEVLDSPRTTAPPSLAGRYRDEPSRETQSPVVSFPRVAQETNQPARKPEPKPAAATEPEIEKRDREKRVLLTEAEERDIERLVHRLAGEFRTPVKLSHLLRGCITAMHNAEDELAERARKTTLVRPGNGNAPELAEFERSIAQVLASAFREARPLR